MCFDRYRLANSLGRVVRTLPFWYALRFDADAVVHRSADSLLAAEITLRRLDGDVAQQELDLVQFPSGIAAQASPRPTEVVRRQILNGRSFGALLYNVPHNPLGHAVSPRRPCSANAPKHAAFAHTCRHEPGIDGALDPIRNGNGPNMSALADQIDDGPVAFPPLKVGEIQFCRLSPA